MLIITAINHLYYSARSPTRHSGLSTCSVREGEISTVYTGEFRVVPTFQAGKDG
ncbi:MAG: hypothetical protein R3E54_18035 [Halioglobus sp.]